MNKRQRAKQATLNQYAANWSNNPDLPGERWHVVTTPAKCQDWSVSNMGRVRNTVTGRIIKQMVDANGRTYVNFGPVRGWQIKRLMRDHWVGPKPSEAHTAVYISDDPTDNRLANLAWMDRDALRAKQRVMALARPRVPTELAKAIIREFETSRSRSAVARSLNSSMSYVRRIIAEHLAKGTV